MASRIYVFMVESGDDEHKPPCPRQLESLSGCVWGDDCDEHLKGG
jgi:hypothetical protein